MVRQKVRILVGKSADVNSISIPILIFENTVRFSSTDASQFSFFQRLMAIEPESNIILINTVLLKTMRRNHYNTAFNIASLFQD